MEIKESVYNLFLIFDREVCSEVGYVVHEQKETDEETLRFLQDRVEEDLPKARKHRLRKPFTMQLLNAKMRLGEAMRLYDDVFVKLRASATPLFVATPVKDGRVFFNYSAPLSALDVHDVSERLGHKGKMVDWLEKYTTDKGIDLPQLINDDYFLAIKLTFNARLYVSAMKLLVCCIDSVAYIEYGNDRKSVPFIKWLNTYADLAPLGITAEELWELRNGLLHMTNTNASKVRDNKVRRISFRVGTLAEPEQQTEIFYFEFRALIQAFAEAQAKWIGTYNVDREKFVTFVERYDETVSDSRLAYHFQTPQGGESDTSRQA